MDELRSDARKFRKEVHILDVMLDRVEAGDVEDAHLLLTLQQAKRVRNGSTLLVRALARLRDQLQPEEGTST